MAFERHGTGDTGRTFESRLFGTAQVDPKFLLDVEVLARDERGRFKGTGKVYEAFKKNYLGAGAHERGETPMSTDLRVAVEDALGLEDENEELKFYSTVGTIIDHAFGVDAFFELRDPRTGAYARVTLDATLNTRKQQEGWKADVIVGELPDGAQESEAYLEKVDALGAAIAAKLQRRLQEQLDFKDRGRRAA